MSDIWNWCSFWSCSYGFKYLGIMFSTCVLLLVHISFFTHSCLYSLSSYCWKTNEWDLDCFTSGIKRIKWLCFNDDFSFSFIFCRMLFFLVERTTLNLIYQHFQLFLVDFVLTTNHVIEVYVVVEMV